MMAMCIMCMETGIISMMNPIDSGLLGINDILFHLYTLNTLYYMPHTSYSLLNLYGNSQENILNNYY